MDTGADHAYVLIRSILKASDEVRTADGAYPLRIHLIYPDEAHLIR
jgi:hypothetical protein